MNRSSLILLAISALGAIRLPAETTCENMHSVTEAGRRYTDGRSYDSGLPVNQVGQAGSRYVRVNIHVEHASQGTWALRVRDSKDHLIQVFTGADFASASNRWTSRINGPYARFDLVKSAGAEKLTIRFDYFVAMPKDAKGTYYSLQSDVPAYIDLYDESNDTPTRRLGDYVGFFMTSAGANNRPSWSCSGVMLSPTLFLTNWHCGGPPTGYQDADYWNSTVVREAVIDLSWDDDSVSRELSVETVVAANRDLDYALLRVAPIDQRPLPGGAVLRTTDVQSGEHLQLIHHPIAAQKQVSICTVAQANHESWILHVAGTDFTHRCDTAGGSSGGPVFDQRGLLVGLHHRGFDYDDHCNRIGSENKAVKIRGILDDIRSQSTPAAAEISTAP